QAIEQHGALDVARLQRAELLLVAVVHELPGRDGVGQSDGMTDLMGGRIADIVDDENAVETDLPALLGVEADHRTLDGTGVALARHVRDVRKRAAERLELRADQNAGATRVVDLGEPDTG